jgi:DNA invertase Pin-like site-specific DNA recombinase
MVTPSGDLDSTGVTWPVTVEVSGVLVEDVRSRPRDLCGCRELDQLCDSQILVYETTESISSHRPNLVAQDEQLDVLG